LRLSGRLIEIESEILPGALHSEAIKGRKKYRDNPAERSYKSLWRELNGLVVNDDRTLAETLSSKRPFEEQKDETQQNKRYERKS
jgi:hypothetical protein